jgi:hypothetical protein
MGMPLETRNAVTALVTPQRAVFSVLAADGVVALSGSTKKVTDSTSAVIVTRDENMNYDALTDLRFFGLVITLCETIRE